MGQSIPAAFLTDAQIFLTGLCIWGQEAKRADLTLQQSYTRVTAEGFLEHGGYAKGQADDVCEVTAQCDGHMKNDGWLSRSCLYEELGDKSNIRLVGVGQNFRVIPTHLRYFLV